MINNLQMKVGFYANESWVLKLKKPGKKPTFHIRKQDIKQDIKQANKQGENFVCLCVC